MVKWPSNSHAHHSKPKYSVKNSHADPSSKEIHLQNRKFTLSNEQHDPTLSKLDTFFCNEDWDITFSNHILHALSSSLSDHCPLLLANNSGPKKAGFQPDARYSPFFWRHKDDDIEEEDHNEAAGKDPNLAQHMASSSQVSNI
jgi:hypothetical protein